MATRKSTPTQTEPTEQLVQRRLVNEGIARIIEAHGIDVQKNRYKAMRAIAWQSFVNAIEGGTFDTLVAAAIANVDQLPAGWEITPPSKPESAVAPPLKKPATEAANC